MHCVSTILVALILSYIKQLQTPTSLLASAETGGLTLQSPWDIPTDSNTLLTSQSQRCYSPDSYPAWSLNRKVHTLHSSPDHSSPKLSQSLSSTVYPLGQAVVTAFPLPLGTAVLSAQRLLDSPFIPYTLCVSDTAQHVLPWLTAQPMSIYPHSRCRLCRGKTVSAHTSGPGTSMLVMIHLMGNALCQH